MAEQKKNEVAEQKPRKMYITEYLSQPAVKEQIANVLGEKESIAFVSDVVACVQNNPGLAECTNSSIFSGALIAKTIGLPLTPTLGYAYLVPFDNKKNGVYVKEAQFQMGYKGYVQLALRSGMYEKIIATDVRRGEVVSYNPFEDEFEYKPCDFEKRHEKDKNGKYIIPVSGYYAKMKLLNGFIKEAYMPLDEMLEFAKKYSKAYRRDIEKHTAYSHWTTRFEDMAKKTMIRQLLSKWGLLTPELQKAYESDMAVIGENGEITYVDNMPDDQRETVNPMGETADVVVEAVDVTPDIEIPENFK